MSDEATTKERILDAAIRAMDAGGQAALRIVSVAHDAGVSQGMIRYYFGDRDRMIAEAMARRFRLRYQFMLAEFAAGAELCTSQDDVRALIERSTRVIFVVERSQLRLERNSDIGTAKDYPFLAEQIAEERNGLCKALASVLASLQRRGLLGASVDPLKASALYLAVTHGVSLWEVGPEFVSLEDLRTTFLKGYFATLFA